MKLPRDQPFWTSVILHIVALVALFLATIIETFRPKEKPHVFEMVSPPGEQTSNAAATPAPPLPDIPMPDLPPVPDLAEVPEPVAQRPAPAPSPPRPTPTPVKPKPEIMTEREFQERFGAPTPRQQTQAPSTPRRINPDDFKIDAPTPIIPTTPTATGPRPLTQQQLSALGAYSAKLRASIDRAWAKPDGLAGTRVTATVVFDVSSSGRITNARLKPGSGNSAFDQSVLAAFGRAVSAGPTPTGQGHSFTMTFRMSD